MMIITAEIRTSRVRDIRSIAARRAGEIRIILPQAGPSSGSPLELENHTLASTSRGMSSNCVWALARREDGGYQSQVLAQPGSASTKPTTIQRLPARCSGNKPRTCGCCFRCLPILIDICSRDDASLVRSGASFVDLRRLVDFRPFPKSAHLGVHRFTHDSVPLQISSLECLIGRECHDHQDDKNGNDEGWNKPGSHCAFRSPGCGV